MSADLVVIIVVAVIAASPGIGALVMAWRKEQQERSQVKSTVQVNDADAAEKFGQALDRAAAREVNSQMRWDQREKDYQERLDKVLARVSQLEKQAIADREANAIEKEQLMTEIRAANKRAERYEEYSRRLSGQVISMGGTPVAIGTGPLGAAK